ncbi:zinc finger matrin-type protein 1-like isoform X2 [Macaca mulatta]
MEMDSQGSKEIKTASPFVGLQSSGAISAHCVLDLLGSRDNPNSASQVSATTGFAFQKEGNYVALKGDSASSSSQHL